MVMDAKCFCPYNARPWVFRGNRLPMITTNPSQTPSARSNAMTALRSTSRTAIALFAAVALMIIVALSAFSATNSNRAASTWHKSPTAASTWHVAPLAASTWNLVPTGTTVDASTWH
jgi:heme/copper-type cytochrome/quinol oxidase subunit 2